MRTVSESDRKPRILDAAERAFAEAGFEGASLRDIVLEAKVNLATVYYYFGSKEGLLEAVLQRRFGPIRDQQLARLNQLEGAEAKQPVGVEQILEALISPPMQVAVSASASCPTIRRLIGRIVAEPNTQIQSLLRGQYQEVRSRYIQALQRSLPQLPQVDVLWRMEFVWGALAIILCNPGNIKEKTGGVCDPLETSQVLAQMLSFFAGGVRAPATA